MNKKSMLIPVLLALSLVFFLIIVVLKNKTAGDDPAVSAPNTEETALPQVEARDTEDERITPPQPAQTGELVEPVLEREELFEVTEADMSPFLQSEIAQKWMNELGYTKSEIVQAQRELRSQGYDEKRVNDPGIIMRTLPSRHTGRVTISEISVPAQVAAGTPIPFTLRGTKPSPSYSFTRFDILVQGKIIRINALGNSDGDNEAGLGGPVELSGTLDPLEPGVYRVVVPELGPKGYSRIVVR